MDKYIKESDLFKRILNVDFKHDYDGCIKFCQSIPAADVVEVRHGRWNEFPCSYECSVCGILIPKEMTGKWHYCPMCGASMGRKSKCVDCTGGYCEEECLTDEK